MCVITRFNRLIHFGETNKLEARVRCLKLNHISRIPSAKCLQPLELRRCGLRSEARCCSTSCPPLISPSARGPGLRGSTREANPRGSSNPETQTRPTHRSQHVWFPHSRGSQSRAGRQKQTIKTPRAGGTSHGRFSPSTRTEGGAARASGGAQLLGILPRAQRVRTQSSPCRCGSRFSRALPVACAPSEQTPPGP